MAQAPALGNGGLVFKLWLGIGGAPSWAQIQLQAPNHVLDSSHKPNPVYPDLEEVPMSKTQSLHEFAAYFEIKQVYSRLESKTGVNKCP